MIGFTQRVQTVSENAALPGHDIFQLYIDVTAGRMADREYSFAFILDQNTTAVVESLGPVFRADFDALFGVRVDPLEPLTEGRILHEGETMFFSPLSVNIRNDFLIEEEECFTINIFPIDFNSFTCNDEAESHFCSHTICIEDNDGTYVSVSNLNFVTFSCFCQLDLHFILFVLLEPFEVALVETTYTVDESVGSVSVCVNLTRPEVDILDETVNVFVVDNSSSVYIPPGSPLASEANKMVALLRAISNNL